MKLYLFTASYPYDEAVEQTLLQDEVVILQRYFDKVTLVPLICKGNKLNVPEGVDVDCRYASTLRKNNKLILIIRILLSGLFYKELISRPGIAFNIAALRRLINFLNTALVAKSWLEGLIRELKIEINESIFYTFWFTGTTMGIGMVKERFPGIKLVSRAHGYDIYEEKYDPPYWPYRRRALASLDRLYPDSDAGTNYLKARYPEFNNLFETVRMGVSDPGFVSQSSNDGILRIVSCSMIREEKRVGLLLEAIAAAARKRPKQHFLWHHFGNGEQRQSLQALVNSTFPPNASGYFPGYTTQRNLYEYYRKNPVDVFINVSRTEGTSVAIMEAISCGIPIIATSVGGNTEIVSEENGMLMGANSSEEEIAFALLSFLDDPIRAAAKRKASRILWDQRYNTEINYIDFAKKLGNYSRKKHNIDSRIKNQVLILAFSDLSRDPRVRRQIHWLNSSWKVTACGLNDPQIAKVDCLKLKGSSSVTRNPFSALLLLLHDYERGYWNKNIIHSAQNQIDNVDFELIIANDIETLPLSLRVARAHGVPLIFDAHEYYPGEFEDKYLWRLFYKGYRSYLCSRYIPQADVVLTVSPGIAKIYKEEIGVQAELILNMGNYYDLSPKRLVENSPIHLVHHGVALPSRNIERMIQAFLRLDDRFFMHFYLLAYDLNYLSRLKKLSSRTPRITFHEPVALENLVPVLNSYDVGIFLLPPNNINYKYALPNKLFEFIQARLAVALGPSPDMIQIVNKYGCGIISTDFSAGEFADTLNSLTSKKINEMKEASNQTAGKLNSENEGKKFMDIVDKVMQRRMH